MYIGIDFLIDKDQKLYLSEINTGVPAGAFEYDLVYREQFGKPSGVFDKINDISLRNFSLPFKEHIRSIPYIDDLRKLKIWMDGKGDYPGDSSPQLRLEDKWVQYNILSKKIGMLPTAIFNGKNKEFYKIFCPGKNRFVLKKRLGRNGRGFRIINRGDTARELEGSMDDYIIQPWIDSSIKDLRMSIRSVAFCGEFICMIASLSPREVSNHGYRFYIESGEKLALSKENFRLKKIMKMSWEAKILFGNNVPSYLKESVTDETVSDGKLIIPSGIFSDIKKKTPLADEILMDINYANI